MRERQTIISAMDSIPAEDRDDWIRVGMALHHHFGGDAEGFDLWVKWSRRSDKFKLYSCINSWRSFRPHGNESGAITVGSLFNMAEKNGWDRKRMIPTDSFVLTKKTIRQFAEIDEKREAERAAAAKKAQKMLDDANFGSTPYLYKKGFENHHAFYDSEGATLFPMRELSTDRLCGLQRVSPHGDKRFVPYGMRASGACFRLGGRSGRIWLVEGYATGLSAMAALEHLAQHGDQVIVCFSAANIAVIAGMLSQHRRRETAVLADHDETGMKYAGKTGLPYLVPAKPGMDFNDFHRQDEQAFFNVFLKSLTEIYVHKKRGFIG